MGPLPTLDTLDRDRPKPIAAEAIAVSDSPQVSRGLASGMLNLETAESLGLKAILPARGRQAIPIAMRHESGQIDRHTLEVEIDLIRPALVELAGLPAWEPRRSP